MSKLKQLREEKNITQAKLSEVSGVNIRMIQHYEQGIKDINKAQGITLYDLAQALECRIEDLLEGVDIIGGIWKPIGDWLYVGTCCDYIIRHPEDDKFPKYCPNCGSKMIYLETT